MAEKQKSVLIVDDDSDIRANICDILTDLGYRIDTAHDGPAALELVQKKQYDVALLDFKMPGMNGAALYREMKKIRPEIVAIMVTAYAGSNGVQEALDAGTWRVLRKPVDLSQLLPLVEEASHQPLILLVDDDRDFCEAMWDLLRQEDYRVCIANSETEGLSRIRDVDFQVAILDWKLDRGIEKTSNPNIAEASQCGDGRRVLKSILECRPEAKVCFVTAGREGDFLAEMKDLGIPVCFKPLEPSQLLEMVAT